MNEINWRPFLLSVLYFFNLFLHKLKLLNPFDFLIGLNLPRFHFMLKFCAFGMDELVPQMDNMLFGMLKTSNNILNNLDLNVLNEAIIETLQPLSHGGYIVVYQFRSSCNELQLLLS